MKTILTILSGSYYLALLWVASFVVSMIIAVLLIPVIIKVSRRKGWLDMPNQRKVHSIPIPRLGGVAIFTAIITVSLTISILLKSSELGVLLAGLTIIFGLGIVDDRVELSAKLKFLFQIGVAVAVSAMGIRIQSLHGLMGVNQLPVVLQYLLTTIVIVGLINAYNLIDGVDGLAGGLAFINSLVFALLFLQEGQLIYTLFSFTLAGAILGFLFFNFRKAKIFMGDGGSLLIGFSMAFLGIVYYNIPLQSMSNNHLNYYAMVFASMLIPAYDTLRVFAERILSGKSPFMADANHVHHLLLKMGFNSVKVDATLYGTNILLIIIAFYLKGVVLEFSLVYLFIVAGLSSELITLRMWMINLFARKELENKLIIIKKRNNIMYKHLIEKL